MILDFLAMSESCLIQPRAFRLATDVHNYSIYTNWCNNLINSLFIIFIADLPFIPTKGKS